MMLCSKNRMIEIKINSIISFRTLPRRVLKVNVFFIIEVYLFIRNFKVKHELGSEVVFVKPLHIVHRTDEAPCHLQNHDEDHNVEHFVEEPEVGV